VLKKKGLLKGNMIRFNPLRKNLLYVSKSYLREIKENPLKFSSHLKGVVYIIYPGKDYFYKEIVIAQTSYSHFIRALERGLRVIFKRCFSKF